MGRETFGIAGAKPYMALADAPAKSDRIAVSLGVGENPAKRLPDPFEEELLRLLASTGAPLCIDKGAGGEEAARVERAAARSGAKAEFWEGSFAGFASNHRRQPPLRRLRFRRPARGRRLRGAADQHFRRVPGAAHVRALAPHGRALPRNSRG